MIKLLFLLFFVPIGYILYVTYYKEQYYIHLKRNEYESYDRDRNGYVRIRDGYRWYNEKIIEICSTYIVIQNIGKLTKDKFLNTIYFEDCPIGINDGHPYLYFDYLNS